MDTYRTEEEQVEAIKNWWKSNGVSTITTIAVAIALVVGWRGWQDSQVENAATASSLYQNLFQIQQKLEQQATEEDFATADHLTGQLKSDYESSAYARYAALLKAKRSAEKGDMATAEAELQWALVRTEGGVLTDEDLPLRDLLQLRLAKIYLAQEKFEDAQAALKKVNAKQFKAIGQELEGDIFYAQGELDRARKSYQLAMDNADRIGSTEVLRIKMSNL
ncbi:MAG: tetratricopeptide repeat protein [Pseudomonadales bacterium]|nr:tetratricopeptide repeat protein [Pseudomonadales bacterium]